MLSLLEYAAIGAVLVAAGALGIARAAVYFRRTESGSDRFFATSCTSVTLVAVLVSGVFFLGYAALGIGGTGTILAGLCSAAYAVILPFAMWRWIGPKTDAAASFGRHA